jgi:predicted nucleic acid-binding protein
VSLVVADTTPINYLVLCGAIDVLRPIYSQVVIPSAVLVELKHHRTPPDVRAWVNALPEWVSVKTPVRLVTHPNLGLGEREAIALAKELNAVGVLIDERLARDVAIQNGIAVTGTVGVLEEAALRNLIDLASTLEMLRRTNFRFEEEMFQSALARVAQRKQQRETSPNRQQPEQ